MAEYLIQRETLISIANAIRAKTGSTDPIAVADMAMQIESITGGGSSENVRYVTFMSEDGTTELYKKAVVTGDDCVDVVVKGLIDSPTKESTEQYNYVFAGWSTEPSGALNADALKAVTEDRTVYANFASVVRYYTVNFYDGETLVDTVQTPYGSTAETDYSKDGEGYVFVRWEPSNENITADTDCYGVWEIVMSTVYKDIVEKTLSGEYYNDRITRTGVGAFRGSPNLTALRLPNLKTDGGFLGGDCPALKLVDLTAIELIKGFAFWSSAVETLILRGNTVCPLESTTAFKNTPFENGAGYIYVPSALVNSYKSATQWSTYSNRFRAIEDYPDVCGEV